MPQEGTQQDPAGQEPTGTQEPASQAGQEPTGEPRVFDEAYVKKLRDEAAGSRTRAKDLEQRLKEYEDRDKTDAQKAAEKLAENEKRAAAAEAKLLRFEIAAAKGLPPKWASRLTGSTKEELEADAAELLKELGPDRPSFDGGPRQTVPQGDMDMLIRRAAGRGQ